MAVLLVPGTLFVVAVSLFYHAAMDDEQRARGNLSHDGLRAKAPERLGRRQDQICAETLVRAIHLRLHDGLRIGVERQDLPRVDRGRSARAHALVAVADSNGVAFATHDPPLCSHGPGGAIGG